MANRFGDNVHANVHATGVQPHLVGLCAHLHFAHLHYSSVAETLPSGRKAFYKPHREDPEECRMDSSSSWNCPCFASCAMVLAAVLWMGSYVPLAHSCADMWCQRVDLCNGYPLWESHSSDSVLHNHIGSCCGCMTSKQLGAVSDMGWRRGCCIHPLQSVVWSL